jgi:hypothetical protein
VQPVHAFGFLGQLGHNRNENARGGKGSDDSGFVAVGGEKGRNGGEIACVRRAVVVLEVVDAGVLTLEAAARPGLAGGIGCAAGARKGSLDVPWQAAHRRLFLRRACSTVGRRPVLGHGWALPSGGRRRRGPAAG